MLNTVFFTSTISEKSVGDAINDIYNFPGIFHLRNLQSLPTHSTSMTSHQFSIELSRYRVRVEICIVAKRL